MQPNGNGIKSGMCFSSCTVLFFGLSCGHCMQVGTYYKGLSETHFLLPFQAGCSTIISLYFFYASAPLSEYDTKNASVKPGLYSKHLPSNIVRHSRQIRLLNKYTLPPSPDPKHHHTRLSPAQLSSSHPRLPCPALCKSTPNCRASSLPKRA